MGKTHRNSSFWMETRFKLGDPQYPEETHFQHDGRFQARSRNKIRNTWAPRLDPLTMKRTTWAECNSWFKTKAKRTARHKAKIMVNLEIWFILEDEKDLKSDLAWDDDDNWYYNPDHDLDADTMYSMEAAEYAQQRRDEELYEDLYGCSYDPMDDYYSY